MSRTCMIVGACAAALALPLSAGASDRKEDRKEIACNVAISYANNNATPEVYTKDFVVGPGSAFNDDFSTTLRQKQFSATAAREAGDMVVSIDYFNDVGVFHAVGFNTRLTLRNGRGIDTTAGSNTFSTSLGVAGNHRTSYTLTCRRL